MYLDWQSSPDHILGTETKPVMPWFHCYKRSACEVEACCFLGETLQWGNVHDLISMTETQSGSDWGSGSLRKWFPWHCNEWKVNFVYVSSTPVTFSFNYELIFAKKDACGNTWAFVLTCGKIVLSGFGYVVCVSEWWQALPSGVYHPLPSAL